MPVPAWKDLRRVEPTEKSHGLRPRGCTYRQRSDRTSLNCFLPTSPACVQRVNCAYRIPRGYPRQHDDVRQNPPFYIQPLRRSLSLISHFSWALNNADYYTLDQAAEYPSVSLWPFSWVADLTTCMVFVGPSCKAACNGPSGYFPFTVGSLTNHISHVTTISPFISHHRILFHTNSSRVGVPELAAAVSNAGGLGILTALTQPNPDALREAIRKTRKLTDKPFGVNITLLPSINPPDYEGYARAAVEEGIRVFETAGNNRQSPLCSRLFFFVGIDGRTAGPLIRYFKQNGCVVIHKCECHFWHICADLRVYGTAFDGKLKH